MSLKVLRRRLIIDQCLTNKQHFYPDMPYLLERCREKTDRNICQSTIEKDIKAIENEYGIEIKYSKIEKGYYYDDDDFSITNHGLKNEDFEALEFASSILSQLKNVPILGNYSAAIDKIMRVANIRRNLPDQNLGKYIQLEKSDSHHGDIYLDTIIQAITDRRPIKAIYQPGYSAPRNYSIHPYLLKEYRNRWYVVGFDEKAEDIRTFSLDRFSNVSINEKEKFKFKNFNGEEYFKNTIGITAPQIKPPLVRLKFTRNQAQYYISQPIHESQKVEKESNEHIILTLKVNITYELISLILSCGNDVEVLAPETLKNDVINKLRKTMSQY